MKVTYECDVCHKSFDNYINCKEHEDMHPMFLKIEKQLADPDMPDNVPDAVWIRFKRHNSDCEIVAIYEINRIDMVNGESKCPAKKEYNEESEAICGGSDSFDMRVYGEGRDPYEEVHRSFRPER